jgi:hypothetical protein
VAPLASLSLVRRDLFQKNIYCVRNPLDASSGAARRRGTPAASSEDEAGDRAGSDGRRDAAEKLSRRELTTPSLRDSRGGDPRMKKKAAKKKGTKKKAAKKKK